MKKYEGERKNGQLEIFKDINTWQNIVVEEYRL